ncbi:heterogeneous nuclear ribonucleoprotein F/H [Vigna unguiculata]|uniref:Heterogeneous nuclear ribonucleoprotein F/H n=1 Tax=Vigna unguiculata TaxID=3917 RepID=A0A4D6L063_VIGUN|nr:heterogeneous nuclear ribonucleoprotein F/H [Vigna unguiculata]
MIDLAIFNLQDVKGGSDKEEKAKLHREIKELLKEANSLSQPSTFAQGAKLKRKAAAKEKELAKFQNLNDKDSALYSRFLLISKVLTYLIFLMWFWSVPVASISQQLVQPFGRLLSWRTGGIENNNIMKKVDARDAQNYIYITQLDNVIRVALDPYRLPPSTEAPFARSFGDLGNMYGPRGGLPFNCTDIDILKFFAGLTIVDVLLVNKSGRFSGEAFVVFAGAMQVEFALQRDRQNMGRRYVEVFRCKKQDYYNAVAAEINYEGIYDNDYHGSSPPPSRSKRFSDKDQMEYTEILKMRGLPFQVTKSQIVEFFKDFNLIEDRVHIACRPDGKATGEAYVEFVSAEEAKRAMSKDKMTIGSSYGRFVSDFNIVICREGSTSNVGFSATTSSFGKSQFSEIASGSIDSEGSLPFCSPDDQILERPNLKEFSFGDLKSAAKSFKGDTLLGEGGFGRVYKGWLDEKNLTPAKPGSGMVVAIKKLNPESTQGFQEWKVTFPSSLYLTF